MNKLIILIEAIIGEIIKFYYHIFPYTCKTGLNQVQREHKIIVSLTSYGRRVSSILPITIYSLFRQKTRPDHIILWLDSDNWNDEVLPTSIKRLKQFGLEVRYCEDIKSFKKIVPTLELYPDALIVTADDDLFYKKTMISDLYSNYLADSTRLYVHRAHRPTFDSAENLQPYDMWQTAVNDSSESPLFPTTGGGCLYHRSFLYKDVCNKDLFMSLTPKADDVWLYFMAVLVHTPITVLKNRFWGSYISLDTFYQYFHSGSNLSQSNRKESLNDVQITNVMRHYSIEPSDLIY